MGTKTWNWTGLKKVWDQPVAERQKWVMPYEATAVSAQCKLLAITRSVVYKKRQPEAIDKDESLLLQLLDEEHTRHPFYGTRRMTQYLRRPGRVINRKRVQRLMQKPGLNTSKPHPSHTLYPYLLRGVEVIVHTHQAKPSPFSNSIPKCLY